MTSRIRSAEIVLPCADLDATVAFFVERLAFRIDVVFPADDPRVVVLGGHGVRLRLERGAAADASVLRLSCDDVTAVAGGESELAAPNGTRVLLVPVSGLLALPPLVASLRITRRRAAAPVPGRAGMLYRDLLPGRYGGRFIASLIEIPGGGAVPDWVHHHRVCFQLLCCVSGWVRVVYEDQGAPFVLSAGDVVLQPPGIRHRVLEGSAGLEVLELSSPAEHETFADHELELPTPHLRPERRFGEQRFVRHHAAHSTAAWQLWRHEGFESRDTGVEGATGGVAGASTVRRASRANDRTRVAHDAELAFWFVTHGALTLDCAGHGAERLEVGDAAAIPGGLPHALIEATDDAQLLEVTVPARPG